MGLFSSSLRCHSSTRVFYNSSMDFLTHLRAAVFSLPFLAAITNHRMLVSNHLWFNWMLPFVPICDAIIVSSGQTITTMIVASLQLPLPWPFVTSRRQRSSSLT